MLETSRDVLLLTLAGCVALLTIFSCWGIFYVVQIIRRAFKMIKGVEEMIASVREVVITMREKLEHSAAYLSIISEGVKKVMEIAQEHTGASKRHKKKE
jgi:hypothetical protein